MKIKNNSLWIILFIIYTIVIILLTWRHYHIVQNLNKVIISQEILIETSRADLKIRLISENEIQKESKYLEQILKADNFDDALFMYVPLSTCDDCNAAIYEDIALSTKNSKRPIYILTPLSKFTANKKFFSKYNWHVVSLKKELTLSRGEKPILFSMTLGYCKNFIVLNKNESEKIKAYFENTHNSIPECE